jgi:diguanylate cyclase (GGDEF)-like protein
MALKFKGILRSWLCCPAVFAVAVFAFLTSAGHAQQQSFTSITAGLGNLNVNCIAQDPAGYLWIGTENGLYRYDGRVFRQVGTADGLSGHGIQSLFVAPDGTLFVGATMSIFFSRSNGHFAPIHPPAPVNAFSPRIGSVFTAVSPDEVVTADRNGAFLLRRVAPGNWVAERKYLDGNSVWSVLAGPQGVLWYGCDDDLCRLQDGKTTHLAASLKLPPDRWLHLRLTHDGHLWLRGENHLGELIPAQNRFEEHDLPGHSNKVPYTQLIEESPGRIVVSQGSSLGIWEDGRWRFITPANGLSRYDISELFTDREGSLWIGIVGHGLMRWIGQDRWEAYTAANGLSNDIVWATLRDHQGRLWIGTESGLDYVAPGDAKPTPWTPPGIETSRAVSLAESADGAIWMGSAAGKLVRIDPKTLAATQWAIPEVYRVLSDGDHRIWIATGEGLFVADAAARDRSPHRVEDAALARPHELFTDLALQPAPAAAPDQAQTLWAAGEDCLYRFDTSRWHRIDSGLSALNPAQIAADAKGNLWAAGQFPGLMRLRIAGDRIVESEHVVRPQLLSDRIVSMAVDRRGWLWVGQDSGLTVFDGHAWRSFTQDDGLIWNDTDSDALFEDRDGSMWIGTSGGLSHLMKPQPDPAGPPAAPVFSQVAFGSATLANGARIPWSPSPLAVNVAALEFRDAGHILLRYRLLGVEPEWVETSDRTIRYPSLDPGSYRLQAMLVDSAGGVGMGAGADGSGQTASPIAEMAFTIDPRWWQSKLLRMAVLLLLALVLLLAWRSSMHLLMRQKRHLEDAVELRTEALEREKTDLLRAREQMRHFAEHDDLTGLWNHRIIVERLRQEVDRSRRERTLLSVILVDLDHFKMINDSCGHPAGDLVLKEIGAIFQTAVRSYDWVGRYGGEEFLLILPGSGFAGARIRAEQLRTAVQRAHIHDGQRAIAVTASFGVACGFPSHFEALIQAADNALYRAKDNGRNCVVATEIEPDDTANLDDHGSN